MLTTRDQVLQQALALPAEDRAFVAASLAQSLTLPADALDPSSEQALSGAEFLIELQRRSIAFRNGSTTSRPGAEVLAELRKRQQSEPSA